LFLGGRGWRGSEKIVPGKREGGEKEKRESLKGKTWSSLHKTKGGEKKEQCLSVEGSMLVHVSLLPPRGEREPTNGRKEKKGISGRKRKGQNEGGLIRAHNEKGEKNTINKLKEKEGSTLEGLSISRRKNF